MGYSLSVENENGEKLQLSNSLYYDVLKIEGLGPPSANINTSEIAGIDGAIFNSSVVSLRNIVLNLNIKAPIEENRQRLYRYFKPKRKCKLYYKNNSRDVYIEGYVETFESDLFDKVQQPQISIICPEPFFKAVDELIVEFSNTISLFEFPFAIPKAGIEFSRIETLSTKYINAGDVETGMTIQLTARGDISNPIIYNRTTQQFFGVTVSMSAGDVIVINTTVGAKSVTLTHGGVTTNVLSKRVSGSKWLRLAPGENEISYEAAEGAESLNVSVTAVHKYEGV